MKTHQDIRSRLKTLESKLDFALKQRDECISTHDYIIKHREVNYVREQINLLTWVLKD